MRLKLLYLFHCDDFVFNLLLGTACEFLFWSMKCWMQLKVLKIADDKWKSPIISSFISLRISSPISNLILWKKIWVQLGWALRLKFFSFLCKTKHHELSRKPFILCRNFIFHLFVSMEFYSLTCWRKKILSSSVSVKQSIHE